MLKIVVCEDNQRILSNYEKILDKIIRDNSINAYVTFTTSNVEELESFIRNDTANLFLMDIDLKANRTGFDLAFEIREKFKKAYIIFITGHLEYVFQAFKVRPFNFLAKPVSREILEETILQVYKDYVENSQTQVEKFIEVRSAGVLHKIKISDIICIQRAEDKTIFHFENSQIYTNESLSVLFERMNDSRFVRCHKSYVCNRDHIAEYKRTKGELRLQNGMVVDVGRIYKKELFGCE